MFLPEKTFAILRDAGFQNSMEQLPLIQRVTHPSSKGYPDATFDYLWVKNSSAEGLKILNSRVSDHYPVTCDIEIPTTIHNAKESQPLASLKIETQRHPAPSTAAAQLVTIMQPVTIQIPYGHTMLPRGMKLPIVSRDSNTVNVRYLGEVYPVALSATDLH